LGIHDPHLVIHHPQLGVHDPRLVIHDPQAASHHPHLDVHEPQPGVHAGKKTFKNGKATLTTAGNHPQKDEAPSGAADWEDVAPDGAAEYPEGITSFSSTATRLQPSAQRCRDAGTATLGSGAQNLSTLQELNQIAAA
jgi:hypothetical protein